MEERIQRCLDVEPPDIREAIEREFVRVRAAGLRPVRVQITLGAWRLLLDQMVGASVRTSGGGPYTFREVRYRGIPFQFRESLDTPVYLLAQAPARIDHGAYSLVIPFCQFSAPSERVIEICPFTLS